MDHRFDGMRDVPLRFARFWILQAVAVFVILLPVAASAASQATRRFGLFELVGIAMWLKDFLFEVIADSQKSAFRNAGKPGFISSGLWGYSRHPNYFGESLL